MDAINGFILLNKDMNITSHSVLTPLKKILPKKTKIGHTGTLDPNATGLLPVAIGRASKFIQYLGDYPKKYRAGFIFGKKTDTQDIWGNIIEERGFDENLSDEDKLEKLSYLRESISSFIGEIDQVPPMYSAIKKDGKALYKYAREGFEVERQSRKVIIFNIDIIEFNYPEVMIDVECSKGTYIRTLIEDIALKIGQIACMTSLIRLKSDGFNLKDANRIDVFQTIEDISARIIKIEDVFSHLPRIKVDAVHQRHICNGVPVDLNRFVNENENLAFGLYTVLGEGNEIFALAKCTSEEFKTLIVI